jgi:hypothetical protein
VLVLSAGCREEILYLRNPEDCGYTTEHINALFIHTLLNHIMAAPFGVAILDAAKTWAEDFVENIRETDYWGIFCASAQACNKTVVDCDPSQY